MSFIPKSKLEGLTANFKFVSSVLPKSANRLQAVPRESNKINPCDRHRNSPHVS